MSTTLTNGLKLPDKGSVDWYADMQNNYTILDGAVGTIAEHTLALAGKANVVHTHVKADITDLLNSNFIPSANNSYDLGSSSYQWNNLYAKNYYYNGTAWGLDKANTWTGLNTFSFGQLKLKSSGQEIGVTPANSVIQYFEFNDKNNEQHGIIGLWDYTDGASEIQMYVADKFKNGQKDSTGTKESTFFSFGFKADGSKFLTFSGQLQNSLLPNANNTYDLGSSSYKWKTLNGTNPGALSFPNLEYSNSNKWIDFKSSITNTAGGDNWYYPAVDGWIFIIASGGAAPDLNVLVFIGSTGTNFISGAIPAAESSTGARWCQCLAPAGSRVRIRFNKGSTSCSIEKALFIPCQGNT